ncbi:MAG: IS66 family insertion sequence element accessory protein TnpB [Oligoflexia bacterium]|nr:IS66 family insertion sequence element accessory protein TnpB [Oligoflexia bacterium]MBF0367743.1 IS66 family insertion sequence element accessory protein TnpB [Oligoflexia bacterium]
MIQVTPHAKILLCSKPIDFRLGMSGLYGLCKNELNEDPFSGAFFLFINKKKNSIKILVYDEQGFWLMAKKLSQGQFSFWPAQGGKVSPIHASSLSAIIYGLKVNEKMLKRWRPFSEDIPGNSRVKTDEDSFSPPFDFP